MSVLVVCDSAAALDPAVAAVHGVHVVPLTITVATTAGPVAYADGDLSDAELERSAADGPVTTAAPAPGGWLEPVERHAGPAGAVLVTVAARLSSSARSATVAANLAAAAGAGARGPVEVVDSGSAAGGETLVVLAAARAATAGADLAGVCEAARAAARRVRLVGALGSLDRLAAGGRLPETARRAGRALRMQPVFELTGGRVRPLVPAFSRPAALDRLLSTWRASCPGGSEVVVSHALAGDDAQRLAAAVQAAGHPCTVGRFGSALLAHAGAGTVGLSWMCDTLDR